MEIKEIIKKVINVIKVKVVYEIKDLFKKGITYLHEKLSELEDYILLKITELGEYAERKILERLQTDTDI